MPEPSSPSAVQPVPGLVAGATAAWRGFKHALSAPNVRRTYLQLTAAILVLAIAFDVAGIWAVWTWTDPGGSASWWWTLALVLFRIVGIVLVLLITPMVAAFVVDIVFPLLNERVFLAGMATVDEARARELEQIDGLAFGTAVGQSLVRLLLFLGLSAMTFALSLVPLVGAVAGPVLGVYFTSRALGWELLDPYFEKLSMRFDEQHAFIRRHRAPLIGFALPYSFVLAIPVLGPFAFGLAQAAAGVLVAEVLEPRTPPSHPSA